MPLPKRFQYDSIAVSLEIICLSLSVRYLHVHENSNFLVFLRGYNAKQKKDQRECLWKIECLNVPL
jgi:hypothetical protein